MSATSTIQNIGSISKTITATAIFQLWERGLLHLDTDINAYLDFPIRHPKYPDIPITIQQLLTHRSSILDSHLYLESYRCGDPAVSLKDWLSDYFGGDHDQNLHFHSWRPGTKERLPLEPRNYSNIGFGVLGLIVESVVSQPFEVYCQEEIFHPLEMQATGWHLKDINIGNHATLYDYLTEDFRLPPGLTYNHLLPKYPEETTPIKPGTFFPHCLYSFYNYPDGLLRTSICDLANFLVSIINKGLFKDFKLLDKNTIEKMLEAPIPNDPMQGLCWRQMLMPGKAPLWGHGGNDPGTNTLMYFNPQNKKGIIIFTNSTSGNIYEIMDFLFDYKF
jgi:CubicO group peptidase (beta-lactamase class C family)